MVYYIGGNYDSCYYVRCLLPLQSNLWDGDQTSIIKQAPNNGKMLKGVMASDVVVFHRPMTKEFYDLALKIKAMGKKVVMDNDDTYRKDAGVPFTMTRALGNPEDQLDRIDTTLKDFASIADLVTVSTDFLANEYKEVNDNVVVLQNCVDKRDWYLPQKNTTGKIRVGLVGSVASHEDYEQIIPLLNAIKGREDIQLVLFALPEKSKYTQLAVELYKPEFDFWEQYNPEWQPFVQMSDYMKTLAELKLDIALIPRKDNYFNRCKSNLKFLEMSMLKIPVIAQGFDDGMSPYQVDTEDAEHMIICKTEQEWIEAFDKLSADKGLRDLMGEKAYNYVLEKYDIKNNNHKWAEAYENIWQNEQ